MSNRQLLPMTYNYFCSSTVYLVGLGKFNFRRFYIFQSKRT